MTEKMDIYICRACGNIVEVDQAGAGVLVCCGDDMELLFPKGVKDEGKEKHVPVIERTGNGIRVKVGSNPHPMEEKHYISWITVVKGDMVMKRFLGPGQPPEAEFPIAPDGIKVYEYCTVHGLWFSE